MLSRSMTHYGAARLSAARRIRRLTTTNATRIFCSTNGCTSFLELDVTNHVATCPICGFVRQIR